MYADIGGMDIQKQEVREAVELPLTHFELYKQVRYAKEFGAWFKLGVNIRNVAFLLCGICCLSQKLYCLISEFDRLSLELLSVIFIILNVSQIGIDPPRGVLMYGPPGCGKTMLAKAVAHHTTGWSFSHLSMQCPIVWLELLLFFVLFCFEYWWIHLRKKRLSLHLPFLAAFIRVVGSEFVQKYLGEGPRMVRDVFRLAKENAPAIIFIDEIDAIATKRFDAQTGGKRVHAH